MRYFLTRRDLRLLKKLSSVQLEHSGQSIKAGTTVTLGEPVEFSYDHDVLNALEVQEFPGMFILERDTDRTYWLCAGEELASKSIH